MSDAGRLAKGIALFAVQMVAIGVLVGVGFRLADKLMNKLSKKTKLK